MNARTVGLIGVMVLTCAGASISADQAPPAADEPRIELTEAETIQRVKADVARRLRVEAGTVRTIEAAARTWPDIALGCSARRGVLEPMPVPGFRIVTEADGRRFVYHTDRFGRLLRCATPTKPLDPIR